jgi:hypothetical protein
VSVKRKYPKLKIDNKPPKDWDLGYELVVSFSYGLDEEAIALVAGLRNYDTGYEFKSGKRDLMFPCGTNKLLAHNAANRLLGADRFKVLTVKISYPVEHEGKDDFTSWYTADGRLLERVKHRKLVTLKKVFRGRKSRRRRIVTLKRRAA